MHPQVRRVRMSGSQSVRRRVALATWRAPRDGRIYTRVSLDVSPALAYVEQLRARSDEQVTLTHVVGAALGRCLAAVPEVRARVVAGRIVPYPRCDVGFAVDVAGDDLAPVVVRSVDTKSPLEVAREVGSGAMLLRARQDRHHNRSSALVRAAPGWAMRPLLAAAGVLVGGLGVGALGQPGFPLGAAFVSNVGTFGLDEAYLAPLPFARVPLYLAVGAVREAPAVIDGRVVAQPQVVLGATADHRLIDGSHAGRVCSLLRDYLADPDRLETGAQAAS